MHVHTGAHPMTGWKHVCSLYTCLYMQAFECVPDRAVDRAKHVIQNMLQGLPADIMQAMMSHKPSLAVFGRNHVVSGTLVTHTHTHTHTCGTHTHTHTHASEQSLSATVCTWKPLPMHRFVCVCVCVCVCVSVHVHRRACPRVHEAQCRA